MKHEKLSWDYVGNNKWHFDALCGIRLLHIFTLFHDLFKIVFLCFLVFSMSTPRIVILGRNTVGLATALFLNEILPAAKITVVGRNIGEEQVL